MVSQVNSWISLRLCPTRYTLQNTKLYTIYSTVYTVQQPAGRHSRIHRNASAHREVLRHNKLMQTAYITLLNSKVLLDAETAQSIHLEVH